MYATFAPSGNGTGSGFGVGVGVAAGFCPAGGGVACGVGVGVGFGGGTCAIARPATSIALTARMVVSRLIGVSTFDPIRSAGVPATKRIPESIRADDGTALKAFFEA